MTAPEPGREAERAAYEAYLDTLLAPVRGEMERLRAAVIEGAPHELDSVDIGPGEQVTEIAVVPADDLAAAHARIAELETQLAAVTAERDEHRRELTQAIAGGWTDDATRRVAEISADNAMLRAGLEAVRPVLDCFKRGSDGWRGRVSAVILARAYAAIGAVPGYLKHVEGQ